MACFPALRALRSVATYCLCGTIILGQTAAQLAAQAPVVPALASPGVIDRPAVDSADSLAEIVGPQVFGPRLQRTKVRAEFSAPAMLLNTDGKLRSPWYAPFASLAIPGAGQAILRQQRSVAYLVAEGFLVIRALRSNRDRNAAKAQYQKLAADVARAGFGTDRPPGPWDYYEILEHFPASGAYDMSPTGRFTPEADTTTYNGKQWYLARRIFWADPDVAPPEASLEYQRALSRYQTSAMQGSYRFSWKDQANVQSEYILSIAEANRSSQQVVSTVGLLAANHLASLVDAYITVRLRKFGGAGLVGASIRTELRPSVGYGDNSYDAAMTLSVPFGSSAHRR